MAFKVKNIFQWSIIGLVIVLMLLSLLGSVAVRAAIPAKIANELFLPVILERMIDIYRPGLERSGDALL